MTEALATANGRRGWIISDGKAGNDVQTRGVFDALGLRYEVKRVDPRGIWRALSPWGPVSPAERFGAPREPVSSALARFRHRDRAPDHALYSPAQAGGRPRHLHHHPAEPESGGQDGRPLLGAGARHTARAERHHDPDGAAQLHGPAPGRAAGERAGADRRAAAAARGGAAGRPERRFSLYAGRVAAARRGVAVVGPPRGRADGHAVAANAGADHPVRARGDGKARRASSGTARAKIPIRNSWRMPMLSSPLPTP